MIRVYCAGGTGGNIGKQLTDLDLDVCFIDTSSSNLSGVSSELVFLTEGLDGAGKRRATTYDAFKGLAEDVLIRFKPARTLNVVISSLSGGSGSVIAPLITKELIKNGFNTIVIGIESVNSVIEIDNCIKTLKTYKLVTDTTGKSVSLFHIPGQARQTADEQAIYFINLLSLLMDKSKTDEFDTSDIHNYINFPDVTDNPASVSLVEVNRNEVIVPEKNTAIVGTILLTANRNNTISETMPEYISTCVVTDKSYKTEDLRIDNILGKLAIIIEGLDKLKQSYQDYKKVNKYKEPDIGPATSDDVVL